MTSGPHEDDDELALLKELKVDLQVMAGRLDRDEVVVDVGELLDLLDRLQTLGITDLMTPAESARVSLDNLPRLLEDQAGVAALRNSLALAARLTDTRRSTQIRDWWGGTEPEVLVACDDASPSADLFYDFGGKLIHELGELRNILAVPAPDVRTVDPNALWPPVSTVVTNHLGFQEWTYSWGGQLIWLEVSDSGFSVEQRSPLGTDAIEHFATDQVDQAVSIVGHWIQDPPWREEGSGGESVHRLAVHEHRAIEVVIQAAEEALLEQALPPEDHLQVEILTRILQLQMRAPAPDRTIVGRSLRGIATFAGGVLTGVASTYLTSLMVKFGVPPP